MKPLWFGPEDRSLFGWLHVPENGRAREAVVLCPTLGVEAVSARYAYRQLADRLADEGVLALRFDYDGTGDSAGRQEDPGRVAGWLESVRLAINLLRGYGLERLSIVGMRMGATLAADILNTIDPIVDGFVMWDGCASGRTFLREQSALFSFAKGSGSSDDGSIETPDLVYDVKTVADLSAIAIATGRGLLAERVLVLTRKGRNGDRRMNERLAMPHVERADIVGQEELVNVLPHAAKVPDETIEMIVHWVTSQSSAGTGQAIDLDSVGRTRAAVGRTSAGVAIEERALSIGPACMFGIETRRNTDNQDLAPTIYLFNAGVIDHVGPARLWVDLARRWAEAGFRVVRFDLIGLGDSPARRGRPGSTVFPPDALDDLSDMRQGSPAVNTSNAILVGLSSGAYHATEAALAWRSRGLCVVNPSLILYPEEESADIQSDANSSLNDSRRQASGAAKSWARTLLANDLIKRAVQILPDSTWWIFNRLAVESPPARTLSKVVDAGVNVYVIAGSLEVRLLTRGEGGTVRRLRRTGLFHMDVIPELDHTLYERRSREVATALLTEHILRAYGSAVV